MTGVVKDLLSPFSPKLNVTILVGKDNHKRQAGSLPTAEKLDGSLSQDENLRDRQPVVVVGTPGKLMDHAMEGDMRHLTGSPCSEFSWGRCG